MLLEGIKAADINNVKEDDFYLTLVQVRTALLSIDTSCVDVFCRKSRFSVSLPGTQAGVQYPLSRMRHQARGLWCRYEIDGCPVHLLTSFG